MEARHRRLNMQGLCDGHTLYMVKKRYTFGKHIYDIYKPGMILCTKLKVYMKVVFYKHRVEMTHCIFHSTFCDQIDCYVYLADTYLKSSRKLKEIDMAMLKV